MPRSHPQNTSPFFTLPYELRSKIYTLYLDAPNRYRAHKTSWAGTSNPTSSFLYHRLHTPVPALLLTCKRIYSDLAPTVFGDLTLTFRERWRGRRGRTTALHAFGRLDLPRVKKLTLIVDAINYWHDRMGFFKKLTSYEAREEGFENGGMPKWNGAVPPTTGLREFVVVWFPYGTPPHSLGVCGPREQRRFGEQLVGHLVTLKTLEVIRLEHGCPAWWGEFLRERTEARVVCDGLGRPEWGMDN